MQASGEFDMRMRQATGIAKAGYVAEFVRMLVEGGQKVALFGWHRAVYAIWMKRLEDLGAVMYTGSESPAQKNFSKERFCGGDASVMMLKPPHRRRPRRTPERLQHGGVLGNWTGAQESTIRTLEGSTATASRILYLHYYLVCDYGSDPIISDTLGIKRQQSEGILNPSADIVTQLQIDPEHVKKLAEAYLRRKRS
jgi:hypothetical protein